MRCASIVGDKNSTGNCHSRGATAEPVPVENHRVSDGLLADPLSTRVTPAVFHRTRYWDFSSAESACSTAHSMEVARYRLAETPAVTFTRSMESARTLR